MPIRILAPEVIDRIAAGEVLDRPANLIKELVENSLDAGATQIDVEFEQGGRKVLVADNGSGMNRDDLLLSVQRHATSKISSHEDLFKLGSFGFRGEALASIAAVSRLQITSRLLSSENGLRLTSVFGDLSEPVSVSARPGTEVRSEELFGNVPARLKFLKSEPAEHTQIKTALKALGLAHESAGFSVRSKGSLVFHWPAGQSFKERALSVLENQELFEGVYEMNGYRAEVLVSSPQETVNVNRNMWFFVQGRWVQDRSLSAAVMEAYRNLLMHGEYPTVVVRLTVPTEEVDVNVHPTKAQVKFRDSQTAFRVCSRAVREVLERAPWLKVSTPEKAAGPAISFSPPEMEPQSFAGAEFARTQYAVKSFPIQQVRSTLQTLEPEAAFKWASLHIIGQLNQTYIVAQTAEALYLVDQHAAHERVMFERLMEGFKLGNIEVQNLLMPLVFDFSAPEVESLLKHKDAVEKLGLSLERMGPDSIAVQAIPLIVSENSVSQALQKLAYELSIDAGELAWERAIGDILATMACHSVVRAGQAMSSEEMRSLLEQMDHYPLSSFCPHGRPVFVKRRLQDIDREFGRIV